MKHRYFVYFGYNGGAYCGWQMQPNGISVQAILSNAMKTILRQEVELTAAGRTDAGVHARQMVAHFDFERDIMPREYLVAKLNSFLPPDIAVDNIIEVKSDAHARFDAVSRSYEYHIVSRKDVFTSHLSMRIFHPLNFEKMNEAAQILFEYTDFTSFSKLHTDTKTNDCKIFYAKWRQYDDSHWIFTIEGNRFLRNMVRAIVGTLIEVGQDKISIDDFRKIIEEKNRNKAGQSVPAQGLFLVNVKYPDSLFRH